MVPRPWAYADLAAEGQSYDASGLHLFAGLFDPLAIDADVAGLDQRLCVRSAFRQPYAVEEQVDPHGG